MGLSLRGAPEHPTAKTAARPWACLGHAGWDEADGALTVLTANPPIERAPMTSPIVAQPPRPLESATAAVLLAAGPDDAPAAPIVRELDRRHSDGIDVRLLWHSVADRLSVAVADAKTGDAFEFEVEGREALHAFHHPYAHAAFRGIEYRVLG